MDRDENSALFNATLVAFGFVLRPGGSHNTANDRAHQDSLRLAHDLSTAPLRALLSENAISVGKLAAALTHELNTPLGALKSAIDTMVVLAAKQATAPPEAQPRLVAMQSELRHAVNNCMERLKSVIARLQRFIDLHHTERQEANLNDMLGDMGLAGQYDHPKVREIYQTVINACRKHGKHCGVGGLATRPATELGAIAIRAALERAGIEAHEPGYVIMGQVLQGGAGQAPARQAAIGAGLPVSLTTASAKSLIFASSSARRATRCQLALAVASHGWPRAVYAHGQRLQPCQRDNGALEWLDTDDNVRLVVSSHCHDSRW
jgi:hypothetical protein